MTQDKNPVMVMGPVLFNWKPEDWRDYYFRIADEADIDEVFVGEVVCSKREPFFAPLMPEVIERLQAGGKKVVVSTLALIMNRREMKSLRDIAEGAELMIEANDISAASLLAGREFAVGPLVNVYNEGTLDYLARMGAKTVCLPVELGRGAIGALAQHVAGRDGASGLSGGLEVMVFGRLPLAISARCYHARINKLSKDSCQFVCEQSPDGLDVDTLSGERFVAVNGVQTLSGSYSDMGGEIAELLEMGINRFRLSPHASFDMVAVARHFRELAAGNGDPAALGRMAPQGTTFCNGYFNEQPGHQLQG